MHFPSNSQLFDEIVNHQDVDGENNKITFLIKCKSCNKQTKSSEFAAVTLFGRFLCIHRNTHLTSNMIGMAMQLLL